MTRTVYKYPLAFGLTRLVVPVQSEIRHVAMQGESVCLWMEVDPQTWSEKRRFAVIGTGWPVPSDGRYVGTAMTPDGAYVWHVYEIAAASEPDASQASDEPTGTHPAQPVP